MDRCHDGRKYTSYFGWILCAVTVLLSLKYTFLLLSSVIAPFLTHLCITFRVVINTSEELLYPMVPLSIQWPLVRWTGLILIPGPLQPLLFIG